jgi:hypothetical protein
MLDALTPPPNAATDGAPAASLSGSAEEKDAARNNKTADRAIIRFIYVLILN